MTVGSEHEEMMGPGADENYFDHNYETMTGRSNGDIIPFCYDLTSQMVMGNIHDATLVTISNNTEYQELHKGMFERTTKTCVNSNKVWDLPI